MQSNPAWKIPDAKPFKIDLIQCFPPWHLPWEKEAAHLGLSNHYPPLGCSSFRDLALRARVGL